MIYLYAKAVHIIFVICWMAGLFYMPRLFIYHTEAKDKGVEAYAILHKQFTIMENRLWWVITTPAMYITIASALVMLHFNPALLSMGWMQFKLAFVVGLIFYHFKSQQIMYILRDEKSTWTSGQLRMWNEVSTIILFAIVFLVILKSTLNWIFGVLGLLGLAILLMVLIKLYKKYRQSKGEKV
ncbi:putative membrane protein [Sphingobacterium alimentarium]|uniref:Protoporphyrinogen IX oxidase n=1 Tax=Sphingobacterium alimentarium TaxID=797292 RepID=A0A4R3VZM3_9SPHI|nr:CopD family protein [Sphingobacterium alimentarium]TCV18746.1 putative membrane protein [Sphingobacterium alimentarium]